MFTHLNCLKCLLYNKYYNYNKFLNYIDIAIINYYQKNT